MIGLLCGLAWANPDVSTIQRVHELEWDRADLLQLVTQIPGADPEARAAAVQALGRLRNSESLDVLEQGETDPDERVRVGVAHALGWTPGAGPEIRRWLAVQPRPSSPAELARAEHGVEVALLEALGFQDEPKDVALLVSYLPEPWPIGSAAAHALGRLAIHKVDGIGAAADPLCARLSAMDPRIGSDMAWALSRVGLKGAGPAALAEVRHAMSGGYETTRALLVKAAWPVLDKRARDDLFLTAATDRSRLVKVAVLNAVSGDDVGADVLAGWLSDPDPWVRWSAIDALGREKSEEAHEALTRHARDADDPWERASAIRALGQADPVAAADMELPAVVRAAEVEALGDPAAWEKLAASDPEAAVRSAAVGSLLDEEKVGSDVGARLLAARDPAVRDAAVELVGRGDRKAQLAALIPHLRAETDPDVLADGMLALSKAGGPYPPEVDAVLKRVATRPEGRVRLAARALAQAAGKDAPSVAPPPQGERDSVLPTGEVVQVEAGRPAVEAVQRIQRARVETSEGTFVIDLDPATAPLAVANFARLAESRFFDGMVFHRVVPGFVVQTGDPRGDGWGGPGYVIPDEVSAIPYDKGSVGMARSDRDTGGSQWFVTTSDQPHLTGEYTRFGAVVEGMWVVGRLHPGSTLVSVTIERLPARTSAASGTGR